MLFGLLALVALAAASCSFNCGAHGTCQGNVCVCAPEYSGDDCSIWQTPISLGVPLRGQELPSKRWHFYQIALASGSGFRVTINQTSARGDVDLYIQKTSLPSRSNFLVREVSGTAQFTVQVNSSLFTPGTYYLGCYAFSTVTYDIIVTGQTVCPDDCSGHGQCSPNGRCVCDAGFSGPNCAAGFSTLVINGPAVGANIERLGWVYFVFDVPAGQAAVTVEVNQTNAKEDIDPYVRFGSVPTKTVFDFRDLSANQLSSISIPAPRVGKYYVGVFAYATTQFSIRVFDHAAAGSDCASACSGLTHGSCGGGVCTCGDCFEGAYCETSICDWEVDQTMRGELSRNAWNYYSFNLESENTLVVRLTETRIPGVLHDCDLYVRKGQKPTTVSFDYWDVSPSANASVSIPTPMGLYWVGIHGFQRCVYSVILEEGSASDCPNNCTGHGVCTDGQCVCSDPYSGDDCSLTENVLVSGSPINGTVGLNKWQYYNFTTSSGFASFQLMETSSQGAMVRSVFLFSFFFLVFILLSLVALCVAPAEPDTGESRLSGR